jgi:preprotein translocase subunit SecD
MKSSQKIRITLVLLLLLGATIGYIKTPFNLGLDLQGGMRLILEAKDTKTIKADHNAVLGALAVIRNRVNSLGLSESIIRRKGLKQIVVELPGIKDPGRAIKLVGDTALLEFVEAVWPPGNVDSLTSEQIEILAGKDARLGKVIERDSQGNIINERSIFLKSTVLTGAALKGAHPDLDRNGWPAVRLEFNKKGAKKFHQITAGSIGKPLAILLDNEVISAPTVQSAIGDGIAQITGKFSNEEMRDFVAQLRGGALPVPVEIISNKTVGPSLGRDSIEKSKLAGIVGLVFVCIFMIIFYQVPGIMACIALFCYLLMVAAILKLFSATLTLPGIAGLILTVGMAVDANVIIFERIKEEKRLGQTLKGAIDTGFARAFHTIVDANVTTLIAAFVLIWRGTASIRGFGITLSIGILVSMFTAVVITKLLIDGISKIAITNKIFFSNQSSGE